ncbi:MAG: hypothetical protein ACQESH_08375 [Campylobacterota bacterium]
MSKIVLGIVATLLLPVFLHASFIVHNDLGVDRSAKQMVDTMGEELLEKTGIHALVYVTAKELERGESAYDLVEEYKDNDKEQIFLFIAPNSQRIHILTFDENLNKLIDKDDILSYAIGVVVSKDKNSMIDKLNIAIVQSYSELADQVAKSKEVTLQTTIENTTQNTINILRIIVWTGSIVLFYAMFVSPYLKRREKKNKEDGNNVSKKN